LFLAHFLLNKKNSKGVLDEKLSNSQWAGRMRTKSGQKGFTLVEVVMVVAIIGILAAIAVPSFLSWLPNIRLKAAARDAYSTFQKARLEAIKRNQNVVILVNTVNCPGLPNAVPSPGGGYQVFVDNGLGGGIAGNNIQDGGELTLETAVMPANVALCATTFTTAWTGFTSKGLPVNNHIGSITLNNDRNRSYQMNLTISGGVRLQ